jgi:hypothetical protein
MQYPFVELLGASFYCCARVWQFAPLCERTVPLRYYRFDFYRLSSSHPSQLSTLPGMLVGILLSPFQTLDVYTGMLEVQVVSLLGLADAPLPCRG